MNTANKITISRLFLIPFFIIFLFVLDWKGKVISLIIFLLASFSDWLDGYIAREKKQITTTGKIMDPVADKVLVYSAFICFIYFKIVPFWMVIILLARDFLVMALRVELAARGNVLAAIYTAKVKTVLEYGVVLLAFIFLLLPPGILREGIRWFLWSLMGAAIILAVISGFHYTQKAKQYLK